MPRIPVRTEPYTSSTRQHRHFKSKRDLILRTLGKSSYINGSQFVIAWISAKGEVETYASELLQNNVDDVLDLDMLRQLAVQVREGADRKREQLEEIQRKRREEGGLLDEQGRIMDEWADMEPAEKASHLLRSAKTAKAGKLAAEKAARLGEDGVTPQTLSAVGKGKQHMLRPPLTPLRFVAQDAAGDATMVAEDDVEEDEDEDEVEGDEDSEEEAEVEVEAENQSLEQLKTETSVDTAMDPTVSLEIDPTRCIAESIFKPKKEDQVDEQGDITLVDAETPALLAKSGIPSASTYKAQSNSDSSRHDVSVAATNNARQVQVTMTGSPLSMRTNPKSGDSGKRFMLASATPSRPTSALVTNGFITPSVAANGQTTGILAPTPTSGRTAGLMNNVLEGSVGIQSKIMLGKTRSADKSNMPPLSGHMRTPSHASALAKSHPGTPTTPSVQTRSIRIREVDLVDWYAERFESLQQETCRLVVKNWIKVVEPKKQSKFPYNRGDDCRPGWWPENIRHREPDHLQKPERTQILISLIRSSLVPISKLELSTAESTAYITQPRMRTLRDIYKVAKEDERRRVAGDVSDLVVNVPASPPARLTTVARMTILDEMSQRMKEEETGQGAGQRVERKVEEISKRQDLASPFDIIPSATLSTINVVRHQKAGSIGESVFLGAGAIKKRKLDELTQANKENIGPDGEVSSRVARRQKSAKTPMAAASTSVQKLPRPQSTGGLRNGKQPGKALQNDLMIANGIPHARVPGAAGIVSPVDHPFTSRPWSAAGTRTLPNNDITWIADTPTNQRQQRLQQIDGGGITRSGSRNSTVSAPQAIPSKFSQYPPQPDFAAMNSNYRSGIPTSGLSAMGGMDFYVTDINGQPRLLPPNTIPVHGGGRNAMSIPHGTSAMPGSQYNLYEVQHGMSPFSAAPQQGSLMVYDHPPPFLRTNSTHSVASVDSHQSHRPTGAPHLPQQAYTYPASQFPQLPFQYKHMEPTVSAGTPVLDMTQSFKSGADRMMPYANGLSSTNDENAPGATHILGLSEHSSVMRRTATESSSATGSRPTTSYAGQLSMTMSMPLSTSAKANLRTAAGFEARLTGLDEPEIDESRSTGASSSRASHRSKGAEMTLVGALEDDEGIATGMNGPTLSTSTTAMAHGDDDQRTPAAPIVLEPIHHVRELSEMETAEREFVKFSDSSDRDAFWTNDAM